MSQSTNTLGRYQIIREIARSNDIVYEAIDPSIGRRVALKELQLPPNLVGSAKRERIERFYREAKAAGALTHPNIVTIYEVGDDSGRHFIAMEFLEGQTLQDMIEIRGALPPKEAADIVLQVLSALDYAHSRGIIHRDIKPANIQILPGERVKLTDFGIARIMHEPSITTSGQIFGTPSYMSPEQVAGKEIDPRSDLFSLGVVLYESLAGAKPFTGDSVVTITYNIMNTVPPAPQGIPEGLAQIVSKSLAKDMAQRYQSAREFSEALKSDWSAPSLYAGAPPPIFFPPGQQPPSPGTAPPFGQVPPGPVAPGQRPATHQQAPQPNLPPLQFPRAPRRPPGPLLSPGQKSAIITLVSALLLGTALLLAVYGVNSAWEANQRHENDVRAAGVISKGMDLLRAGQYPQALDDFHQAQGMNLSTQTAGTVRKAIVGCYVGISQNQINSGDVNGALDTIQGALREAPNSGDLLYLAGVAYSRENEMTEAVDFWQQAVSRDPDSSGGKQARHALAQVYFSQGADYAAQGDTSNAIVMWQKVLEIDPESSLAQQAQDQINQALLRGQ